MRQLKIIFTGPVGAGKTTAIKTLSDIEVVATEAKASDKVKLLKDNTTVAMDYGRINLDSETAIHLYGTPGQERFNFMWEILAQGALGLVLLIDCSSKSMLNDLNTYIDAFEGFIKDHPIVIGLTQGDIILEKGLLINWSEIQSVLSKREISAPIFEVDARNRNDINALVEALVLSIDPTAQ